jgi:hypothetical protein
VNTIRTAVIGSGLALAAGLVPMTSAAASTVGDQLTTVDPPLITQDAAGYQGTWTIEGGTLEESFEKDGLIISTGSSSLRTGLAADGIVSFGYVAGFGDPDSGEEYAQLSGQAGADVTAVRVISASVSRRRRTSPMASGAPSGSPGTTPTSTARRRSSSTRLQGPRRHPPTSST